MDPATTALIRAEAANLVQRLRENNFSLLKQYICLFGDLNDCDTAIEAGDGPRRATQRLRDAKLTTLARLIRRTAPPYRFTREEWKTTQATNVDQQHAVRIADYDLQHHPINSVTRTKKLDPVHRSLDLGEPTLVFMNLVPRVIYCEADIAAALLMETVKPCSEMANLQFSSGTLDESNLERSSLQVHVRGQYVSKNKRSDGSRLDHTLILHDPETDKERSCTLIEYKHPKLLNLAQWKELAKRQMPLKLGNEQSTLSWFPQVAKYSMDFGICETMIADDRQFLPMEVTGEPLQSWVKPKRRVEAAKWKPPERPCVLSSWDAESPALAVQQGSGVGATLMALIYAGVNFVPPNADGSTLAVTVDLGNAKWRVTEEIAHSF